MEPDELMGHIDNDKEDVYVEFSGITYVVDNIVKPATKKKSGQKENFTSHIEYHLTERDNREKSRVIYQFTTTIPKQDSADAEITFWMFPILPEHLPPETIWAY